MQIALAILQGLIGVAFTPNGIMKLLGVGPSIQHFKEFRYPRWFLSFTGAVEVLAGIGLLVGFWITFTCSASRSFACCDDDRSYSFSFHA